MRWKKQLQFVNQRSLLNRRVRYVKFLGDGDSKSYSAVVESKPYGDTQVEKLEFIGHIQTTEKVRSWQNMKRE